ncbi:MAG TPA: plastocyanin/azurin family copper-binding protein [Solirubrobacteraceae bacterium]|nr:plastocyanin/azurin family copper-binding protein [Solirubrobacteraceae bacterium]
MSQHSADPLQFRAPLRLVSIALTLGALAVAGCGSSKSTSSPASSATTPATSATTASTSTATEAPTGALALSANPEGQLAYNTKSLTAKAGKVTVDFSNSSPLSHNVTIESSAGKTLGATPTFQGGSKTLSLSLKPGTYKFYCSVPGHRMAGMEGTLVVK